MEGGREGHLQEEDFDSRPGYLHAQGAYVPCQQGQVRGQPDCAVQQAAAYY